MQETYCLLNLAQFACRFTVFFNFFQKSQVQSQISKLNKPLTQQLRICMKKTSLTLLKDRDLQMFTKKLIGWNH